MRSETRNRSDKPAGMRVGESQGDEPNRNNGSLCMGKPCSIKHIWQCDSNQNIYK